MPDMPKWIAKGSILMRLDNASTAELQGVLADLEASPTPDIAAIARNRLGISPPAELHLRNDWFSATGWWGRDLTAEIRHGFISAFTHFNLADQSKPKKLNVYWECCCSPPTEVIKFMYHDTGSGMVIIIRTPDPDQPPRNFTELEPFWVVEGLNPPERPGYAPI